MRLERRARGFKFPIMHHPTTNEAPPAAALLPPADGESDQARTEQMARASRMPEASRDVDACGRNPTWMQEPRRCNVAWAFRKIPAKPGSQPTGPIFAWTNTIDSIKRSRPRDVPRRPGGAPRAQSPDVPHI